MERQQALNRVIELSFKWQQKHEWAAAFKAADRFREYRDKGTEQFDQLSEDRHNLVIAAHSEFIAMENLLRVHAPVLLALVPNVNFFTDSATDHSQHIHDVKKLEGAVRAMMTQTENKWHPEYLTVKELTAKLKSVGKSCSPSTVTTFIKQEASDGRINRKGQGPMLLRMDLYNELNPNSIGNTD